MKGLHYHTIKTIQNKYLGGRANPLPHHKNTTTNLEVHLKKGEMEGSTKNSKSGVHYFSGSSQPLADSSNSTINSWFNVFLKLVH